jgi:hypothetical protein
MTLRMLHNATFVKRHLKKVRQNVETTTTAQGNTKVQHNQGVISTITLGTSNCLYSYTILRDMTVI